MKAVLYVFDFDTNQKKKEQEFGCLKLYNLEVFFQLLNVSMTEKMRIIYIKSYSI